MKEEFIRMDEKSLEKIKQELEAKTGKDFKFDGGHNYSTETSYSTEIGGCEVRLPQLDNKLHIREYAYEIKIYDLTGNPIACRWQEWRLGKYCGELGELYQKVEEKYNEHQKELKTKRLAKKKKELENLIDKIQ